MRILSVQVPYWGKDILNVSPSVAFSHLPCHIIEKIGPGKHIFYVLLITSIVTIEFINPKRILFFTTFPFKSGEFT